jgi:hypothetical protein
MRTPLAAPIAATAIALAMVAPALGIVIGGGGAQSRDCLVALDADVNTPESKPRQVRCTDGDSDCDRDGAVNGTCQFEISVCANSTFDSECSMVGVQSIIVDHADDNGDPKFDPDFQSLQSAIDDDIDAPTSDVDRCTAAKTFLVPLKGPFGSSNSCGSDRKKLRITSVSQVIDGSIIIDRDRLRLTCLPDPDVGCDPTKLFASTFDRIQKQVFNQNCALSGCHDSQSQTGSLLLEVGASYDNLVGHAPSTPPALAAGWKRVDADPLLGTGDLENSLLYRKITGDLPDSTYGARMPFGKPILNKTLRDIIRLWIEAGAPPGGWVDGTF